MQALGLGPKGTLSLFMRAFAASSAFFASERREDGRSIAWILLDAAMSWKSVVIRKPLPIPIRAFQCATARVTRTNGDVTGPQEAAAFAGHQTAFAPFYRIRNS